MLNRIDTLIARVDQLEAEHESALALIAFLTGVCGAMLLATLILHWRAHG